MYITSTTPGKTWQVCVTSLSDRPKVAYAIEGVRGDGYEIAMLDADYTPVEDTENALLRIETAELSPAFVAARFKQIEELTCEQF
jgi:hypothetical protein